MELMLSLTHTRGSAPFGRAAGPGCHSLLPSTAKLQGGLDIGFFPSSLNKSHYKLCAVSEKSGLPLSRTQQLLVCCGGFTLD